MAHQATALIIQSQDIRCKKRERRPPGQVRCKRAQVGIETGKDVVDPRIRRENVSSESMLFQLFPGWLRGSRDIAPPSTMPCALELKRGRRRSFIATSRRCQDYRDGDRDGEILRRFDVWIFKKSIFESRDHVQP